MFQFQLRFLLVRYIDEQKTKLSGQHINNDCQHSIVHCMETESIFRKPAIKTIIIIIIIVVIIVVIIVIITIAVVFLLFLLLCMLYEQFSI